MLIITENLTLLEIEPLDSLFLSLNKKLSLDLENLYLHFLTDELLHEVNIKYLEHDYYTDIITFDLRDDISRDAELFISLERVFSNAEQLSISSSEELYRVCIHGMLHLAGYSDKTPQEKKMMRLQENKYLASLFHMKQE